MTNFANALRSASNETLTENGALTYKSTNSKVLDLFDKGGGFRKGNRSEADIAKQVVTAFLEDNTLALKVLFYLRDVRGGQGERQVFRTGFRALATEKPEAVKRNLVNVPFFGRWDDLFVLEGTPVEAEANKLIVDTFRKDMESDKPSLLAKWMPSENASSKETLKRAKKFIRLLGMKPRQYRQALSALRAKIGIVEKAMCQNEWEGINFSHVPSVAAMRYRKAFSKHEAERYTKFIQDVKEGKTKINASTLYPYEIVTEFLYKHSQDDQTLEALWNALPNYMEGGNGSALVIADVSGSMCGAPLAVSISLAMYTAERNKGPFHNMFMTFSSRPDIVELKGKTLRERIMNLSHANWEMSTDLQAAFDKILEVAKRNNTPQDELPQTLLIVSDMEFNCCGRVTNFDAAKAKFEAAGYTLPAVVFWNVASRNNQSPVTMHTSGAFLVSGCSPSILKNALNKKATNPWELMMEVLDSPRYSVVE